MIFDAKFPTSEDLEVLSDRAPTSTTDSLNDFHDVVVRKPWGSEYLLFENMDVAVWILTIDKGQQTSMHCHPKKNTSLAVLSGQAICRTFEREFELSVGEGVYIGKKVFHQSINKSNNRLIMMEIESPVDKFDLVRQEDGYGRVGSGYEGKESCDTKKNLTIESDLSLTGPKECEIGEAKVVIGYVETFNELESLLKDVRYAILSILDRHVWTSDGDKFYEVGQAFKADNSLSQKDLNINTGFHYLLISRL